jgi:hypothetical protein
LKERVSLAQVLWESINAGLAEADEPRAISEAFGGTKSGPLVL